MSTTFSRFVSFLLVLAFVVPAFPAQASTKHDDGTFKETVDDGALLEAYREAVAGGDRVRILIMPGHEPGYGGAEFLGYYERELVVDIAERLATELRTDPALEVLVARGNEDWNDDFEDYFDDEWDEIEDFVDDHKDAMEDVLDDRDEDEDDNEDQAAHNKAPEDVALRLYGVNKWGNERGVDLALHLHLNDEAGRPAGQRGAHSGAAIYVPDDIYGNAEASRAIAEPIFDRITAFTATSTFGLEQKGIVEDRDLIAIGSNNTSEVPSILIEYGYLYEPRITGPGARSEVLADFAYATALGVRDYLGTPVRPRFGTKVFPYQFATDLLASSSAPNAAIAASTTLAMPAPDPAYARGIYALQAALRTLGFFPGTEASLAVCPVSGIPGPCITDAVKAFQRSKGLEETGTIGPRTRALLNAAVGAGAPASTPAPVSTPLPLPSVPSVPVATSTAVTTPVSTGTTTPASAAACPSFPATLVEGADDAATGGNVTRLQTVLAKDRTVYPEGLVTGYFGSATQAAIGRFQAKAGIAQEGDDGYGTLGPRTQAALLAACKA